MSRIVRVSTIGTQRANPGKTHEESLKNVISYLDMVIGKALCDKPDFILLHENSDIPSFAPEERAEFYKYRGDAVHRHIADICKKNKVNICYGSSRDGGDGWNRNSAVFINRDGETVGVYNKNHLVMEEYTNCHIRYGKDPELIETDFGKVGAAICYDLQFDELREKYMKLRPELIVFPSLFQGGFLKQYWAFSNRCWFVSSIGIGNAPCEVINPLGEVVAKSSSYFSHLTVDINLDYCIAHLDYNGERITRMKQKYGDEVQLCAPSGLGRVMITSFSETVSACEMAKEFEIELIDELFARNLGSRHTEGNIED